MEKTSIYYFTVIVLFVFGCSSETKPEVQKTSTITTKVSSDTLHLNKVDKLFLPYMPDTSVILKTQEERKKYVFELYKKYFNFKTKLRKQELNEPKHSLTLLIQQADIMYDEYIQIINYKVLTKSKSNIELLNYYSPYSNAVSLDSVIKLYQSFPENAKKSEVGLKILKYLNSMKFEKNIGVDINKFPEIIFIDSNSKRNVSKSINLTQKKYNIVTFSASWCLPCRLAELQLKDWLPMIDTTSIGIISLSVDRNFYEWKKALSVDKVTWSAYLIENEFNNAWLKMLKVESIPDNFLIDSGGSIVAENTDIRKILSKIPLIISNTKYAD